jgi:hypothetical protein
MRLKATLLVEAGDSDSRHYKKSSVRKKGCLNNSPFSRLRRKSTVGQTAVGLRAGRFGGRASICDTTTMNTTRRTPRRCIRTPSYVHSVHSAELGVDTNNRHTGSRFSVCVHTSNGISRTTILENVRPRKSYLNKLSNVQSHWTCGHSSKIAVPSCENLCPVQNTPSGHSGHCSGEVTL